MSDDEDMNDGPTTNADDLGYSSDEMDDISSVSKPTSRLPQSTTTTASTASRAMPWVEKYRPKGIGEVASQGETVAVLQNAVQTGNLPHLLFYGPPGTGKVSEFMIGYEGDLHATGVRESEGVREEREAG